MTSCWHTSPAHDIAVLQTCDDYITTLFNDDSNNISGGMAVTIYSQTRCRLASFGAALAAESLIVYNAKAHCSC